MNLNLRDIQMLTLLFCIALTVPTVFSASDKDTPIFIVENAGGHTQIAIPTNQMSQPQKTQKITNLVKKAKSSDKAVKLEALIEIHRMLKDMMPLIDDFITAGVLDVFVDCLSKINASRPQLVANAMAALAIIAPRKAEPILEAQHVMIYLNYWLMNSTDEEVKKNAASILEYIMRKLFIKVNVYNQDEQLEGVITINRILKECYQNNSTSMLLINELVTAGVMGSLVDCLSKDNALHPQLVANAIMALAYIAPKKTEAILEAKNVIVYLSYWQTHSQNEGVKTNAASILKNITGKLHEKAKSKDPVAKLGAVTEIHRILKECQKEYSALMWMINELVTAGVMGSLVDCLSNASHPQLVANAIMALAYIAPRKTEAILEAKNVIVYLSYWQTHLQNEGVKTNAASILKNIMHKLVIKAKARGHEEKLEAVNKIREMFDLILKGNIDEQLINQLISANLFEFLVDCLSKHNAYQRQLVANAMAALAIIAPRKAYEIYRAKSCNVVGYLEDWIKDKTTDEEMLKNAISILKKFMTENFAREMDYRSFSNLFNSRNKDIFEEAMCAAYHLIKMNGRIYDETKATHIQSMIELCDDAKTFCGIIENNANGDKVTYKILLAMKSIILNPINQSAEVVKKVEDCRGVIEGLASDKSIAENIRRLLHIIDEIRRFKMDTTNISLDDVADSETKKALQTVMLPLQYSDRFQGFLSHQKSILLDGAQGSGKELLAKAAAKEWSAKLFSISSSVILSKKDDESVDFIKMLFQMAKNAQPSIIFIDEIDAFLRSGTGQRGKAQFLVEMDKLSSNPVYRVLVIGATDRPKEMDKDAIKRFAKRIFVENPSEEKREKMIRKIVEENQNVFELGDEEIHQLAARTENYSFDDLLALCQMVNLGILHNASEEKAQLRPIKMMDLANAIEYFKPKSDKAQNELKNEQKSNSKKRNGQEEEEESQIE
ncbi:hypothetical protein niasHT_014206 [Heterodera trifolii]|uniref:AAA+ ATPase domain-containing protein n=1 Tax=Heterodera trifolii TaxID=157864 RepID=A0ABD2KX27_9BILA